MSFDLLPSANAPFESTPAWRVTLWIIDTLISDKLRPVTYFVRCPDGNSAVAIAERMWTRWEKNDIGKKGEVFPDVRGRAIAINIDKGDWIEYWKSAVKFGKEMLTTDPVPQVAFPRIWSCPGMVFDVTHDQELFDDDLDDQDLQHITGFN